MTQSKMVYTGTGTLQEERKELARNWEGLWEKEEILDILSIDL
jgi:hypothetical protein